MSIKKLNQTERDIIEKRLVESYDYIRKQNSMKKELRDIRGIEKARIVRDTLDKWIRDDNAIKGPRPVKKSVCTDLFETLADAIRTGNELERMVTLDKFTGI